ncbi:MAG: type II secretion system protein GspG [Deltaproteobacteria bacterium]|nr:type II secretion system protein GspG [Deltaproteobacteria bacterium]
MRRSLNTSGFTLIELMIVAAIVGILIAVAIMGYNAFREKAKKVQALSDLKNIQFAIEDLAFDTDRWPGPNPVGETADKEVWNLNSRKAGLVATNGKFPNWNGPYMKSVPKDPWGSNYFFDPDYHIKGKIVAVIGSFGPNRKGRNRYDDDDIVLVLPAT